MVSGIGLRMADVADETTAGADALTSGADARLVRDVRWRLVAWSGGSTLLVLIVLGVALYVSVASSLAASSQALLANRAEDLAAQMRGEPPTAGGPGFDFLFGGGTFAIAVDPTGQAYGPRQFQLPTGLPDIDAVASAKAHGTDVRTTTITFPEDGLGQATRQVDVPVRAADPARRHGDRPMGRPGRPGSVHRAADARRTSWSSSSWAGSWWCSSRVASAGSTPAGPWSRSGIRWRASASPCAGSASSPRTPATSCGPRSRSSARRSSTCAGTRRSPSARSVTRSSTSMRRCST